MGELRASHSGKLSYKEKEAAMHRSVNPACGSRVRGKTSYPPIMASWFVDTVPFTTASTLPVTNPLYCALKVWICYQLPEEVTRLKRVT